MAKYPGLFKRKDVYYARKVIPEHLRPVLGKSEFQKSLKTSDKAIAVERYHGEMAKIEDAINAAQARLDGGIIPLNLLRKERKVVQETQRKKLRGFLEEVDSLDDKFLEQIIGQWVAKQELSFVDALISSPIEGEDEYLEILENLRTDLGVAQHAVSTGNLSEFYNTAEKVLSDAGKKMTPGSLPFGRLCMKLAEEYAKLATRQIDRISSAQSSSKEIFFSPVVGESIKKRPLKELSDIFLKDHVEKLDASSHSAHQVVQRFILLHFGEQAEVNGIDRTEWSGFVELVSRLPKGQGKSGKLESSVRVEGSEEKTIARKTAENYVRCLHTFLNYCVNAGYLVRNNAKGIKASNNQSGRGRRPYRLAELEKLFSMPIYTGAQAAGGKGAYLPGEKVIKESLFWVPLIGLFTGMRLNEICQLETGDITECDGFWVFRPRRKSNVVGKKDRKFKNEHSAHKTIPVHPELVKVGLVDFVKKQTAKGEIELFPDIGEGKTGRKSNTFSKRFATLLKKANLKEPGLDFHSFRHTFADGVRNSDMHPEIASYFGGWARGNTTQAKYGYGYSDEKLYTEMVKLNYRDKGHDLDISDLYETQF